MLFCFRNYKPFNKTLIIIALKNVIKKKATQGKTHQNTERGCFRQIKRSFVSPACSHIKLLDTEKCQVTNKIKVLKVKFLDIVKFFTSTSSQPITSLYQTSSEVLALAITSKLKPIKDTNTAGYFLRKFCKLTNIKVWVSVL